MTGSTGENLGANRYLSHLSLTSWQMAQFKATFHEKVNQPSHRLVYLLLGSAIHFAIQAVAQKLFWNRANSSWALFENSTAFARKLRIDQISTEPSHKLYHESNHINFYHWLCFSKALLSWEPTFYSFSCSPEISFSLASVAVQLSAFFLTGASINLKTSRSQE